MGGMNVHHFLWVVRTQQAVWAKWTINYPTLNRPTPDGTIVAHNTDVDAVKAITKVLVWQVKITQFFVGGISRGLRKKDVTFFLLDSAAFFTILRAMKSWYR